jgi:hypothetical protein
MWAGRDAYEHSVPTCLSFREALLKPRKRGKPTQGTKDYL